MIADWRQFQIASMIPMLSVLLLFFFLPESPRWQISVGRNEQALKTIRKAERFNKVRQWQHLTLGRKYRWLISRLMQVNIPEELLSSKSGEKAEVGEPKQLGIGALFQRANVRRNSLVLFTNWALVSLGYYGISMSSGSLNDNIFISYFLLSLIGTSGPDRSSAHP